MSIFRNNRRSVALGWKSSAPGPLPKHTGQLAPGHAASSCVSDDGVPGPFVDITHLILPTIVAPLAHTVFGPWVAQHASQKGAILLASRGRPCVSGALEPVQ